MSAVNSILMTVFNRPSRVLFNTLHALLQNDLSNCEVLIVDDGSTVDYTAHKGFCIQNNMPVRWLRIDPSEYPSWTYTIQHPEGGVINNPALAMNRAIAETDGRRIVFLSSDCLIPRFGVMSAKRCDEYYWLANVLDQASNIMYVCENRPVPLHFFASCLRKHIEAIGGFDENYLKGIACEDNDFGARLGLHCKQAIFDGSTLVVHQSHPQDAYSDGMKGLRINEAYTCEKWGGGVPWRERNSTDPIKLRVHRENLLFRVTPEKKMPIDISINS